jgi:hypothetical protein
MCVDDDLHHQYRRSNQQHAGNGVEHGVDILDDVIHPTAQVARHDPQGHRQRQGHQGGERTDDQRRADALQGEEEDILPHLVRTEHVVFAGQHGDGARAAENKP